MSNNITKIAIVGGGFTGLSVMSNLLRLIRKNNLKLSLTVFEKLPPAQGGPYNIKQLDNFLLNHEANFMGSINPWDDNDNTIDFFIWLQEQKDISQPLIKFQTIQERYKTFALSDPNAFLPRSLYGLYLISRLKDMLKWTKDNALSLIYQEELVQNIVRYKNRFLVYYKNSLEYFDYVILATGCEYPQNGTKNLLYASQLYSRLNMVKNKDDRLGILGSSLSAIEVALALADKGFKNITLYSRSGRLPKVRGKSFTYTLRYVTPDNLNRIKNKEGYFQFFKLLQLIRNEFDYAYVQTQEKKINWQSLFTIKDPIQLFKKDLDQSKIGKELIWRSVCLALAKNKGLIFPFIEPTDEKIVFEKFSSFILSFLAPLPLPQAEKLEEYIENKTITVRKGVTQFLSEGQLWNIFCNKRRYMAKVLIDARGPEKLIEKNVLIKKLLENGIVEKAPARGILVNETFQSIVNNKIVPSFFVLGSVMKLYAPVNNSTVYLAKPIQIIVNEIKQQVQDRNNLPIQMYS